MVKSWFYMKREEETKNGPFSDEELVKLIKNDIIEENDRIWMTDLDNWIRIGDSIYSVYLPRKQKGA